MLNDWIYWLSGKYPEQILCFFGAILLIDGPRYALSSLLLCVLDLGKKLQCLILGRTDPFRFVHCPTVCVVIAGHNEAKTIEATLRSTSGNYPRLEIIVVDDGSEDQTADIARKFAQEHSGCLFLSRPERGGKSSALNFALPYTNAEVILSVDADSHLGPTAIWEIVQPLQDPRIGAVAGNIVTRNGFANLVTWLQAYEYLHAIFVGRLLAARLNLLGITSGALAAFRRAALDRCQNWDVAPGEDLDLTLRIRKAGYRIAFAPFANCFTNVPTTWVRLARQRLRWDRSGTVRNHCRKHIELACFWTSSFRVTNLVILAENWLLNIVCLYLAWAWIAWLCVYGSGDIPQIVIAIYLSYLAFETIHIVTAMFRTDNWRRDLLICLVFPLAPAYQFFLLTIRLIAITDEFLWRSSFDDDFTPLRVRRATWRW